MTMRGHHNCPNPNCSATDIPNGQVCYKYFRKEETTMPTPPTPPACKACCMPVTELPCGAEHEKARAKYQAAGVAAIGAYGHIEEEARILAPEEMRQAYAAEPESLTVGQLNRVVRNLREEIHRIRIEGQTALADAEQRAKDAETALEHVRQQARMQAQEARTQRSIVLGILRVLGLPLEDWSAGAHVVGKFSTLTRQLETARAALNRIWHDGWSESDRKWAKDALAAIDAPAAEEATSPNTGWCCVNGTDAPPPEPANAQGSEAACREHIHKCCPSHCCKRHGCKYGHDCCPVACGLIAQEHPCEYCRDDPKPPSAPPFTVEEALGRAVENDEDAVLRRNVSVIDAVEHSRVAATLRRYAELLERQPKPGQLHRCIRGPNRCHVADLREGERCYACHALPPSVTESSDAR